MPAIEFPAELAGAGLTVRPLGEHDAEPYAQAFRDDPELGLLLGVAEDPTEEHVREAADRSRQAASEGRMIELAILREPERAFAGGLLLHKFEWEHRRCELGYWLVPQARGVGLAGAAMSLAIGWLFGELGLLRVEIATTLENVASQDLARRLGFTQEALQRSRDIDRGRRVDVVQFGLLREEWPIGGR